MDRIPFSYHKIINFYTKLMLNVLIAFSMELVVRETVAILTVIDISVIEVVVMVSLVLAIVMMVALVIDYLVNSMWPFILISFRSSSMIVES